MWEDHTHKYMSQDQSDGSVDKGTCWPKFNLQYPHGGTCEPTHIRTRAQTTGNKNRIGSFHLQVRTLSWC